MIRISRNKKVWRFKRGVPSIVLVGIGILLLVFAPKRLQWPLGGGAIALSFVFDAFFGRRRDTDRPGLHVRELTQRAAAFVDEWAFLAGIVAWAWDSHSSMRPWIRLGGALCFIADLGAGYLLTRLKVTTEKRKRGPIGMSAVWSLGMAYAISTPQPGETQPQWLTAAGVVFIVLLVFGAIPLAVIEYRSRRDEREMAIATRSLSFAFIVTMVVVLAFSMLETLKIGPTLRANYIIAAAATSWFASWFVLRRRM